MSEALDKENVIQKKKDSIKKLNDLLEKYINEPSGKHLKKANLISHWIKEYVRYINFEDSFEPKKNISYSRGDIIKVAFGFNVGSEYGGLHYAVVLDNDNSHSSNTLTVVPLTSMKDSSAVRRHNVDLGSDIYRLLKVKCDTVMKNIKEEKEQLVNDDKYFRSMLSIAKEITAQLGDVTNIENEKELSEYKAKEVLAEKLIKESEKRLNELKEKAKIISSQNEELSKITKEINNMKTGSIALVGQITTISKIRIYDPKKSKDVLYGIKLSAENMDKINNKIKELYIFERKEDN